VGDSSSRFKSGLRHQKENRGLADSSVSPLLHSGALGQRFGQHFSESLAFGQQLSGYTPNAVPVASFTIAVNEVYKGKDGQKVKKHTGSGLPSLLYQF